jgi:PAS domain-containing protein
MLILRDITDLKKAEDELGRSNERIKMLLHSMPQGILIIDEKNHC